MGTAGLRELLKSLCDDSLWLYAVFWKLRHGSPMVLIWQDGYFDYLKMQKPAESRSDYIYCNIGSTQFETGASNYSSEASSIGHAVTDMSNSQYTLGEGILGKVALMGNHCWVSFNDILTGEVDSELISEVRFLKHMTFLTF
uniref:Transcription factor EMB1444 isoform X1 n=1 Tax=Rhizophora mucronata TaxID=61149 RepID=A0A2P2KUK9_RHIMU